MSKKDSRDIGSSKHHLRAFAISGGSRPPSQAFSLGGFSYLPPTTLLPFYTDSPPQGFSGAIGLGLVAGPSDSTLEL